MSRFKRDHPIARAPSSIQNVSRDTRKTSDEISCLLARGFTEQDLDATRRRAAALHVSPAHLLIAESRITETDFYRCYATSIGAHFTETIPKIAAISDWREGLRSGHVKLADGRWLIAPQGRALAALTDRLSRSRRHDLLLTSPSLLRTAITLQLGRRIVKHAAQHLSLRDASASAQSGVSRGQKRVIAGVLALVCFGVIDGGAIWALCCAIFSAAVAFGVVMRFAGAFRSVTRPRQLAPPLPEALLPDYTILVPLYREANVLPSLIGHLANLDYPSVRQEVLLLIEDDDEPTREALNSLRLPPHMHVLLAEASTAYACPDRALRLSAHQTKGAECRPLACARRLSGRL